LLAGGFVRINLSNKPWFAEEKAKPIDLFQLFAKSCVSINREICGDERQFGTGLDLLAQKITNVSSRMVVADIARARRCYRGVHSGTTKHTSRRGPRKD
jgi:hypothetical protein